MDSIKEVFKVLAEKRLIPAFIGLVGGIAAYIMTPDDYVILIKLGREWYILFWGVVIFLFVTLCVYLKHRGAEWVACCRERADRKKEEADCEKDALNDMWDFIDSLSEEERALVEQLLNNGNQTVIADDVDAWASYNDIRINSNYIKRQQITSEYGIYKAKYKLSDSFYQSLVCSKEKYGRISNFNK